MDDGSSPMLRSHYVLRVEVLATTDDFSAVLGRPLPGLPDSYVVSIDVDRTDSTDIAGSSLLGPDAGGRSAGYSDDELLAGY